MKLRKKKKKDATYNYNIKKTMLILIMLICIIIAMITYWIYAYHHKYGSFYFEDIKLVSYKISDYVETKGDLVHLKNIDKNIVEEFEQNQKNILKNNVTNIEITKEIHNDILSVMISYTISNRANNYEEIISINVNLQNNKILSNDELLKMSNSNYKNLATIIFDENIKLPSDSNKKIIDAITEKELTIKEFNNNREKYIIRIREKLPEVLKLYIEDDNLYGVVRLLEIDEVCYYTDRVDKLINIKLEIGKL